MSQSQPRKKRNDIVDKMQFFTKDNFYLFPVVRYDYTGDDGHIIALSHSVFDGELSYAIDFTQGKALEEKTARMSILAIALPSLLLATVVMAAGGLFNYIVSSILFISAFFSLRKFFYSRNLSIAMTKAARDNIFLDKNTDAYKIATIKEAQSFNCPMDLSEVLHTLPSKIWKKAGLGAYYAPQDMLSMLITILLSSTITHKETSKVVKNMVGATDKEREECINKIVELATIGPQK